jgi:large subunit ribosomal protein L30
MASRLRITLVRSPIGCHWRQRRTVQALGLRKLNHSVLQPANLQILGMVRRIPHLVRVEEVAEDAAG